MSLFPWGSETRFATPLLERLPLGVAVYRLDKSADASTLRLRFLNAAGEDATGLSAADEVGRSIGDILTGPGATAWGETFAEVARTGVARDLGVVEYGDDRITSRTYAVQVVPLPDREVAVLFEDAADRQELRALVDGHAEQALEQERYRALVAATSAIVWQTSATGRFETDQPAWRSFTGQTVEELMGWGWLQAVHPDDRSAMESAWTKAGTDPSAYTVEHRLRHADGTYRRMRVRAVPRFGDDGIPTEWIGTHADVEGDHEVAEALADSDARFRTLFDAISDVVLLYPLGTDGPEPLVAFNQAAIDLYGHSADALLTMTIADLVDPTRFETAQALEELRRTRRSRFESVHLTNDGARIPMQVSARLVELDGALHVLSVCRDDTERRQFQRQLTRNNLRLERSVQERTAQMEAFAADLKILHRITTADHASSDEHVCAYLEAGCAMFEMPVGILSSLPVDPETGETLYRVDAVVSPENAVPAGLTLPLSDAFCDAVVTAEETITYADAAGIEALSCHSAYAERGLRSFIGTPIWDGDTLFGTLNFVSPEPREDDFAPYERELVEVMADAIGRRIRQDRLEQERTEADAWYRSVVETVAEGLVLIDRTGVVLHANPAAALILGYDTADADLAQRARRDGWTPIGPDGQPIPDDALPENLALNSGEPVRGHLQGIAQPDGRTRWYTVNATPLDQDADGVPDVAVVSFTDVTDLRAARAVLASDLAEPLPAAHRASGEPA